MDLVLIMFKENGQRKVFSIDPGKTVIGRKEDCDLRIPLAEISRKHALMIVEGNTVTLRDLGSANGTYVNNVRITEQELGPGDHIVLGPVVFTVQINGQPTDPRPVQTRLEKRAPARTGAPVGTGQAPADEEVIDASDEDPISALEALAASDDTAALDVSDSAFPHPDDSRV